MAVTGTSVAALFAGGADSLDAFRYVTGDDQQLRALIPLEGDEHPDRDRIWCQHGIALGAGLLDGGVVLRGLDGDEDGDARIQLRFQYPMRQRSLRSGLEGWQYYDIALELVEQTLPRLAAARMEREDDGDDLVQKLAAQPKSFRPRLTHRHTVGEQADLIQQLDGQQTGLIAIDSSGLGVLVSLSKKIREQGGELRLANLNDDLKTLFELTKLDTLFQIADTRERALESF